MTSVLTTSGMGLQELLLKGRRYTLNKQQILQSTEDRAVVNIVISGFVRKYLITNDGTIGVQIIYGPGDIFPLTLIYKTLTGHTLYTGPETFFYEAMSNTEVRTIDANRLLEEVELNPKLYKDLFDEAGRHLEFCIYSLENVHLRNSGKRIAHLLLYFARRFGVQTKGGIRINIPLSHQNIAEVLSVTRETVSTNMKELRDNRLVVSSPSTKNILVPNLKKLEEEAYS